MKKVELITLQRVPNYGSVLQAYATQEIIENLGYKSEMINYFPERMTIKAMLRRIKNKNSKFQKSLILRTIARIIIFPSYIKRFGNFKKFYKYLHMSEREYHTNNEIKKWLPNADIYCTGSDQVWNSEWNEGIDEAMFLDFSPIEKKKISFSSSFGKDNLNDNEKEKTKKLLEKYDYISIRELSGVNILNNLGINGLNVLDPTLILNSDEWRKISSPRFKNDKYILVYNLNRNDKINKYAKRLSKATGLKVKYISYQLHEFYQYGKMYCNIKVEDFLSLIDNATLVITDSFHATAFSLNFNTQFLIIYPEKFSTRLQSILKLTNLENRVVKDEKDLSIAKEKIDFKEVNIYIEREREKSLMWFKQALSD